ncbi:MAG TPA: hypothetical protein VFR28_07050 [Allosphingosinicella sp.]|jgi:hypothetical protein|nr:hypothetical protein [Allosphingosinicella sp.]
MKGPALLLAALAGGAETCPPDPPRELVARAAPFGGAIAPTAADAEEAVTGGMVAREAARRFLGLEAPPFLIAEPSPGAQPAPGGCAFVFPWRFPRVGTGERRLPTQVLPHEIGHDLFIRLLAPRSGKEEYGGGAPDWLDEMAAIAFEDAGGVRQRRSEARRHAERGALLPLARLLSMTHPEWSARPAVAGSKGGLTTHQPRSADTPAFYATLRALLDFLIVRTGDERIIRRLAEQARAHVPLDRWLLAHVPGAAGKDLSRLDAQIAAFVLTYPAYDGTPEPKASEKSS